MTFKLSNAYKMKTRLFFALFIITSCTLSASHTINITNKSNIDFKNKPIVIKLDELKKIKPEKRSQLAVFDGKTQISTQLDDFDADNIPDEIAFIMDIKAGELKKLSIKTTKKRARFAAGTYASLLLKQNDGTHVAVKEASSTKNDMYNALHHHGVAFESELMAYRIYFDNKSTIDLYGKKTPQLEIAQTGWYPTAEQLAAGYGDDILLVSGWVGAGAVKGWDGKKNIHIDKFNKRTQRIITTGNVRTIVESVVEGWDYENKKTDMTVRYSIYAKNRDAIVEVITSNDLANIATGVQQIGKGKLFNSDQLLGSWGAHFPQPDTVKYKRETVGLGMYMPKKMQQKHVVDGANNLFLFPTIKNTTHKFHITALWAEEKNNKIFDAEAYFESLKQWQEALEAEIEISIK